jgi:hypothetical protein
MVNWQAFSDYGQVSDAHAVAVMSANHVADAGLGLDAGGGKGPTLHASLAHRLQGAAPLSEPYPRTKILLQAGWVF